MNNNEQQIYNSCKEEPSLIFTLIKQGEYDLVFDLLQSGDVNINVVDSVGNDTLTRLLKAKQYDYVIALMKKRNWNVNHQNDEGNTFGHILAGDNSVSAVKVIEQLTKKKNYLPNIKNNKGKTALDLAIGNHYLCTAFKLLEDKRFNDITIFSFKNLLDVTMKSKDYGKYSKITNLEIIVNNLEKKELNSGMKDLVDKITDNFEAIKKDIMNNKSTILESIVNNHLVTA